MLSKEEFELQVFLDFIDAVQLDAELTSVKSEKPPLPDISCKIDGKTCYFELTRIADQALANDVGNIFSVARKTGKAPNGQVFSYSDKEVLENAVFKKTKKNHETNGCRFDLLLYCDGVFHPRIQMDLVRESLKMFEKTHGNKWHNIWLYDQTSKQVLWPEN